MTREECDQLAHLANDWDAMAAALERDHLSGGFMGQSSQTLRDCAGQLRDRLLKLRAPVPG